MKLPARSRLQAPALHVLLLLSVGACSGPGSGVSLVSEGGAGGARPSVERGPGTATPATPAPKPAEESAASIPAEAGADPDRAQRLEWLIQSFEGQRKRFEEEPSLTNAQVLASTSAQILLDAEGGNEVRPDDETVSLSGAEDKTHVAFSTNGGHYKVERSRLPALAVVHDVLFSPAAFAMEPGDAAPPSLQAAVRELAEAAQGHVDAGTVLLPGERY